MCLREIELGDEMLMSVSKGTLISYYTLIELEDVNISTLVQSLNIKL